MKHRDEKQYGTVISFSFCDISPYHHHGYASRRSNEDNACAARRKVGQTCPRQLSEHCKWAHEPRRSTSHDRRTETPSKRTEIGDDPECLAQETLLHSVQRCSCPMMIVAFPEMYSLARTRFVRLFWSTPWIYCRRIITGRRTWLSPFRARINLRITKINWISIFTLLRGYIRVSDGPLIERIRT